MFLLGHYMYTWLKFFNKKKKTFCVKNIGPLKLPLHRLYHYKFCCTSKPQVSVFVPFCVLIFMWYLGDYSDGSGHGSGPGSACGDSRGYHASPPTYSCKDITLTSVGDPWHFGCGSRSGSPDPYLWLMDPDPTPFFSDLKDAKKIIFLHLTQLPVSTSTLSSILKIYFFSKILY